MTKVSYWNHYHDHGAGRQTVAAITCYHDDYNPHITITIKGRQWCIGESGLTEAHTLAADIIEGLEIPPGNYASFYEAYTA